MAGTTAELLLFDGSNAPAAAWRDLVTRVSCGVDRNDFWVMAPHASHALPFFWQYKREGGGGWEETSAKRRGAGRRAQRFVLFAVSRPEVKGALTTSTAAPNTPYGQDVADLTSHIDSGEMAILAVAFLPVDQVQPPRSKDASDHQVLASATLARGARRST
jgi:hypothetical protein